MIRKLKANLKLLIETNSKGYILLSAIFAAGVAVSAIVHAKTVPEEEIRLYMTDFISNTANAGADSIKTFYLSVLGYVKVAAILFFSSVTIIGAPVALLYALVGGFSYGTVILCLFRIFGAKAFLIVFCSILPHAVVSAPCCLVYAFHCMQNSHRLFLGNVDLKKSFVTPLVFGVFFLGMTSVAALIQAYVEPLLISLIASQFI